MIALSCGMRITRLVSALAVLLMAVCPTLAQENPVSQYDRGTPPQHAAASVTSIHEDVPFSYGERTPKTPAKNKIMGFTLRRRPAKATD
jgi:hypothetical protein